MALRREMYDAAGGPDPQLRFGNDTEFGYRLAQAGAVFVPEPLARSWHLGPTHVMRAQDEIARYRLAFLADLVPFPRHWRKVGGTAWTVPLVEVAVAVRGRTAGARAGECATRCSWGPTRRTGQPRRPVGSGRNRSDTGAHRPASGATPDRRHLPRRPTRPR